MSSSTNSTAKESTITECMHPCPQHIHQAMPISEVAIALRRQKCHLDSFNTYNLTQNMHFTTIPQVWDKNVKVSGHLILA